MNWYIGCLKKYVTFSGRARRKEYWMFYLFNIIFLLVAALLDNLLGLTIDTGYGGALPYGWIYMLYAFAVLLPGLAVFIRRLHDLGKSGWWIFISLIPLVGGIWLLVLMATDSQPGQNQYGLNPKGVGNPTT
jgi:uncharacterized membrane protein YhaH (DUF805 family)